MEYPRVEPGGKITCDRKQCDVVFYRAPGARPFIVACQNKKCGHKGFVRADHSFEAEGLWKDHLMEGGHAA